MNHIITADQAAYRLQGLTLFWDISFSRSSKEALNLLQKKKHQLEKLKAKPFETLRTQDIHRMNYLEEEIKVYGGVLVTARDIVDESIKETGDYADLLRSTWAEAEWYKQQLEKRLNANNELSSL